ncbi:MAG TPA: heterodisulfide reductase, subunit B [Bacteroidetes bacterium]|uniref:Heterodisulfide reductase, subunit B n=1 Tax=candidate division TA06 bacterium TaxID=2250710 RepID=A0A660SB56_UNCT6|nr:MAG: heterodisulfide reductase, subunit B [candidate division TA06 bacterium]HHD83015.1 heterodisulfide reductase, subunit B [Bacteroidota bacterium]
MKLPYYPGCTLKTKAKNFETSTLAVAKELDIELVELPKWNCCGAVSSIVTDDLMHQLAPARNFVRVLEMNKSGIVDNEYRLVALCSMCYNTLKRTNLLLKNDHEKLKTINDFMYLEEDYNNEVEVVHFLEILRDIGFDKVKEKVKVDLSSLKIAPYYGCLLLRPKEIAIDNTEDPRIESDLLDSLGVKPIDNPFKKMCCGAHQTVQDKYAVARNTYTIVSGAIKAGAEAIITSCPLCAFNLDNRQREAKELYPDFEGVPILYFTQVMGLAFGVPEEELGFDLNYNDPRPLLREKNILK